MGLHGMLQGWLYLLPPLQPISNVYTKCVQKYILGKPIHTFEPQWSSSYDEHHIIFYILFLNMLSMAHCHILVHHHGYVHAAIMKQPIFPLFNPELCKILYTETEIIEHRIEHHINA
jgi:hypothetical protein